MILVGEPKRMDNTPSDSELLIAQFIEKLKEEFPSVQIKRIDERFTSKMAFSNHGHWRA